MIAADQHHLEDDNFFPATVYWRMCDVARTLEREVKRWKEHFIPFAIIHAAGYGRDHYGEGCLHFTHYDLLAEAGARMDDFKRCGAPSSENKPNCPEWSCAASAAKRTMKNDDPHLSQ